MIVFLLVVNVSAQALIFKKGESIDLNHPIRLDGFPSTALDCNITIFDPDNIKLVDFQPMTNGGDEHNYLVNESNTTKQGVYPYDVTCTTGASNRTDSFQFEITASGENLETGESIIYIIVLVIAFFIFCLLVFGSFKIPWRNSKDETGKVLDVNDFKWVKLACMVFSYLVLMFILSLTHDITINFLFLDNVGNFFQGAYMVLLTLFYPMMVLMPWVVMFILFQDRRVKKLLERGLPVR